MIKPVLRKPHWIVLAVLAFVLWVSLFFRYIPIADEKKHIVVLDRWTGRVYLGGAFEWEEPIGNDIFSMPDWFEKEGPAPMPAPEAASPAN